MTRGFRAVAAGLTALVTASALGAGCRGEPPPPSTPPALLLVTVDTLRADHVGSYGFDGPITPHLDRLASRGVRFADATVSWPKTWPSTATILTGTRPATHGVRLREKTLAAHNRTLAEALRRAGYRTGAVVSNVNLAAEFGFDQGFEVFVESWVEALREQTGSSDFGSTPGAVKRYTNARIVTDQGLRFLDGLEAETPFFLWLHYMDPHGPYAPPSEDLAPFEGRYPPEPVDWAEIPPYQRQYDPEGGVVADLGFYKARYAGEVRRFDAELGRLLAGLAERRLDGRTLVALTADHGESLSEHGYYLEHGKWPYQSTAHVPLVLAWPGRLPEGRVVEGPVGLVGLAPTLLELLGVPHPTEGTSFVPLLAAAARGDPEPATDDVYMEAGYRVPSQVAVRRGRFKLVRLRAPGDRAERGDGEYALFDLDADPAETRDVAAEHPELSASLRESLARFEATLPQARAEAAPGAPPAASPTTRRMLEALGYVGEAVGDAPGPGTLSSGAGAGPPSGGAAAEEPTRPSAGAAAPGSIE